MISVYQAKDHRWRDSYNPLRGLNMCRLVSMLEAGERGQYADLQWFYYFMERSDAMIASVIQRRRAALLPVDWDIRVVAGELTTEGTENTELTSAFAKGYGGQDGGHAGPSRSLKLNVCQYFACHCLGDTESGFFQGSKRMTRIL